MEKSFALDNDPIGKQNGNRWNELRSFSEEDLRVRGAEGKQGEDSEGNYHPRRQRKMGRR